ncbi:MAG: energy transducer TonB [Deltaproteobacteria bacterium]|nr:energy transducer TonB [Deltaproteobacteria bacterium]
MNGSKNRLARRAIERRRLGRPRPALVVVRAGRRPTRVPDALRGPVRLGAPEPLPRATGSRPAAWLALSALLHAAGIAALLLASERHDTVSSEPIPIAWLQVEAGSEATPAAAAPVAQPEPEPVPAPTPARAAPRPRPAKPAVPAATPVAAVADPSPSPRAEPSTAPVGAGGPAADESSDARESIAAAPQGWMPRGGSQPAPVYPARARRAGVEGTAQVELLLESSGRVAQVRLRRSSGDGSLDVAALDAVERWRFDAPPPGADYRDRWFLVPIKFRLQ